MKSKTYGVGIGLLGLAAILCFSEAAISYAAGMSPSGGSIIDARYPSFSWAETPGATWYQLWIIRNGQTYETPWVQDTTTWGTDRFYQGGSYQWWVRAWGPGIGMTEWSDVAEFSIPVRPPGVLDQISPEGPQATHALTYRWETDPITNWYQVYVLRSGARVWHDRWFEISGANGMAEIAPFTRHPGVARPIPTAPPGAFENPRPTFEWAGGECLWWVRGWNPDGMGPWSGPMSFSIWQPANSWYRVYVTRVGGARMIDAWTSGQSLLAPVALPDGEYSWWLGIWDSQAGRTIWSDRRDFRVLPPPVFVQGGTLPDLGNGAITVNSFYIGKHEVTWGEWKVVRAESVAWGYDIGYRGSGCADNHPVHTVKWYDVVKWCNLRSEIEGLTPVYTVGGQIYRVGEHDNVDVNAAANGYRLPTDAEWEFAARGGTQSQGFEYSGSDDVDAVAWYRDNSDGAACNYSEGRGTWPVGEKAANELEIHDMSGNVFEWCFDWHPSHVGSYRVVRGGSFTYAALYCRVSARARSQPGSANSAMGFRIVLSAQ